jgi:hypothetical protein
MHKEKNMMKQILFLILIIGTSWGVSYGQKNVKVLHTFKGQGNIGTSSVVFQINMLSNGQLKGFYSTPNGSKNTTYFLQGNRPIGDSQQTTVYISENDVEKAYLIMPYDIEELEIIIGKWYSLDGTKTQEVYVKRIR